MLEDREGWAFAGFFAGLMAAATPAAIGVVTSLFTDFGRTVEPEFMIVMAQVFPVVLLAAFVEAREVLRRVLAEDPTHLVFEAYAAVVIRLYVTLFALGEGLLLYAIAAEAQSTFLVVTSVAAMVMLLADMAASAQRAQGIGFATWYADRSQRIARYAERQERVRRRHQNDRASEGPPSDPGN